jgi:low affinity Fe/Cu permease
MGTATASPTAFLLVIGYAFAWGAFGHDLLSWHGVATLGTWIMTLFIQRAEHRDTQAIQAKLDELLHTQSAASNKLTRIDEKEPEEIEAVRQAHRAND